MKKSAQTTTYPRTSKEALVNQKMLYLVRDEIKSHSHSLFHELKAENGSIKSDMLAIKSDMMSVRADIDALKSGIDAIKTDVHRIALLVEEQNNRNKLVLDGLSHLFNRQERIENEFVNIKK